MDKAEIEKLINDWFDNDRGSTGTELNRKELSSSITTLIIKWLEGKKIQKLGKNELTKEGMDYYIGRNQLITELIGEVR